MSTQDDTYYETIVDLLGTNPDLKKTIKGILSQAAYASGSSVIGGVVGGPIGAWIGGVIGAVAGYKEVDEYDSLIKAIKNLSGGDRKKLVKAIQKKIGNESVNALKNFVKVEENRKTLGKCLQAVIKSIENN